VLRFLETFQQPEVRNLTGWMIGIIKTEKEAVAQEKKRSQEQRDAAAERPAEGWEHKGGRPLEEAKVGKVISGRVTNELHGRFWLNAGFAKDVTFQSTRGRFQIGDELVGVVITNVDLEKGRVEAKATRDTRKRGEPLPRGGRRASTSRAANAPLPLGARTRTASEGSGQASGRARRPAGARSGRPADEAGGGGGRRSKAEGWKAAAVAKPAAGWKHEGARPLAELQVGEIVGGRVTNRLHERFWVNIGATHDASFWHDLGDHKVGDALSGMRILSINLEKNHVVLEKPSTEDKPKES